MKTFGSHIETEDSLKIEEAIFCFFLAQNIKKQGS